MSLVAEIKRLIDDEVPEVCALDVSNDWSPQPWFNRKVSGAASDANVPEFEIRDLEEPSDVAA
jgi:hypothetical protein